jgi:hypothetical protein
VSITQNGQMRTNACCSPSYSPIFLFGVLYCH